MPKRLTYEYVRDYIKNEGFSLTSTEYVNAVTKLKIQCPKGHIFEMRFNDFKNGFRCKHCSGKAKYLIEDIRRVVEEQGYTLLSKECKNSHSYVELLCPRGHCYKVKFYAFQNNGNRCAECAKKERAKSNTYSYEKVKSTVEQEGYTLLSEKYLSSDSKIKFKCNRGHEFKMTFKAFNHGQRCPRCNCSKGEALVSEILAKEGIKFYPQYPVAIDNSTYYYDFYIPVSNGIFIEYDGVQHFKPIEVFKGEEGFIKTKERDEIKNGYVTKIQGDILRIPYYLTKEEVYERIISFLTSANVRSV